MRSTLTLPSDGTGGGRVWSLCRLSRRPPSSSIIKQPSDTILFGEKETKSPQYFMDLLENPPGNDFTEIEQSRHSTTAKGSGGSNFTFADGGARYLPFGKMLMPENLWAVTELFRF